MDRCPLCGALLVAGGCPICSALGQDAGEGDTERAAVGAPRTLEGMPAAAGPSTQEETPAAAAPAPEGGQDRKAAWYALAGIEREELRPQREQAGEPLPEVTKKPEEDRGFLPAGLIFIAAGLAGILVVTVGVPPNLTDSILQIAVGSMLLTGSRYAQILVFVGCALHVLQMVVIFLLTGSWLCILAMAPTACVLAAFWLDTAKLRAAAGVVGVALAFGWLAVIAMRPAPGGRADALRDYAIESGVYSDAASGLTVKAPVGVTLYDMQQMAEALKSSRSGILGKVLKDMAPRRNGGERVVARGNEGEIEAVVGAGTMPPHLPMETVLPALFGEEETADRNDDLVPRALREVAGLKAQGYSVGSRSVLLLRAADGRQVSVRCHARSAGGARLCQALFDSVSLRAGPPAPAAAK